MRPLNKIMALRIDSKTSIGNSLGYAKPAQGHISLYQLILLILQLTQSTTVCVEKTSTASGMGKFLV